MNRFRFTSEIGKGAALGVGTLVAFLVVYAALSFSYGETVDARAAEHLQTVTFLGRMLLAGLFPSALVGGLLGALARKLRKARTLLLAGAAIVGAFVVMAASFAIQSTEPLEAAWFGLLMGMVLTPLLVPFALVAAVILARWTRPGVSAGRSGAIC